ncbi:hypothetical protein VTK26DRAFT_5118 [Humicola hyalothermophila]
MLTRETDASLFTAESMTPCKDRTSPLPPLRIAGVAVTPESILQGTSLRSGMPSAWDPKCRGDGRGGESPGGDFSATTQKAWARSVNTNAAKTVVYTTLSQALDRMRMAKVSFNTNGSVHDATNGRETRSSHTELLMSTELLPLSMRIIYQPEIVCCQGPPSTQPGRIPSRRWKEDLA